MLIELLHYDAEMYGEYSVGEGYETILGGHKVVIERLSQSVCRYIRSVSSSVFETKFYCKRRIGIYPLAPLHVPFKLTQLIYIKLENPVVVPPGKTLQFYVYLPVEIGIYAHDPLGLIDVFSPDTPKYAVYGTPEQGVIGRVAKTEAYVRRPGTEGFRALSLLILSNLSDTWVNVSKIIVPGGRLRYHYSLEKVVGPRIIANVESQRLATVVIRDEHHIGTRPGPYPEVNGVRYTASNGKYTMIWGV